MISLVYFFTIFLLDFIVEITIYSIIAAFVKIRKL